MSSVDTANQDLLQISPELTDEQLLAICEVADVIACECPSYLVRLVQEVREFRRYTRECVQQFPEDANTHDWLNSQASQVESLLTKIIVEFLHREDLIREGNQLQLKELSNRVQRLALRQCASPQKSL